MEDKDSTEARKDLITSRAAVQAFIQAGLSEATFHRSVQAGEIESVMPQGRQRGAMYPRDQVTAAINKRGKKKIKRTSTLQPTTLTHAAAQDMPEVAALLEALYGAKISAKKRATWIEKNPEITYILRSESKIVGCAFILPLREETILNSLNMEVKPAVKPDEILLYEPGNTVCLYLRSVGVAQSTVSKEQYRYWSARLVLGLAKALVGLASRGVVVEKIYAQGDTKQYQRVLKLLGFIQIASTSTLHKNFMLDVPRCYEEIAMRYKRALNAWRAQNEEE